MSSYDCYRRLIGPVGPGMGAGPIQGAQAGGPNHSRTVQHLPLRRPQGAGHRPTSTGLRRQPPDNEHRGPNGPPQQRKLAPVPLVPASVLGGRLGRGSLPPRTRGQARKRPDAPGEKTLPPSLPQAGCRGRSPRRGYRVSPCSEKRRRAAPAGEQSITPRPNGCRGYDCAVTALDRASQQSHPSLPSPPGAPLSLPGCSGEG